MKREWRKVLACFLICAMVLQTLTVYAADNENAGLVKQSGTVDLVQRGEKLYVENDCVVRQSLRSVSEDDRDTVRSIIYYALLSFETDVDLQSYEITVAELEEVIADVVNSSPELFFYVEKQYSYWTSSSDADLVDEERQVVKYCPQYGKGGTELTETEVHQMQEDLNAEIDLVLSKANPDWSDLEKALYIHDYLVMNCKYDTRDVNSDTDPCAYDMYSLLVEGRAVCEGYALAFMYFMERMGISCTTVPSDTINHMWNKVQLDGEWYHVDVTWDDPMNLLEEDVPGQVCHTNFLLSDIGIQSQGHSGWDMEENPCTDTTYDSYFWKDLTRPFVSDGTNWYFVREVAEEVQLNGEKINLKAGIYRWNPIADVKAESAELVVDLSDWCWESKNPGSYYTKKFTVLTIYNGIVYFNTPNQVLYFDSEVEGQTTGEVLESISEGQIFAIQIQDGALSYAIGTPETIIVNDEEKTIISMDAPQSCYEFEEPEATYPPYPTLAPVATPAVSTATPTVNPTAVTTATPTVNPTTESTAVPTGEPAIGTTTEPTMTPAAETPIAPADGQAVTPTSVPESGEQPTVTTEPEVNSAEDEDAFSKQTKNNVLSQIKISAKKGKRKVTIRVPKKTKVVITSNKKILLNKKKKYKKLKISSKKNRKGKIVVKLSSKLKKKMKISVTVYQGGEKYRKILKVR